MILFLNSNAHIPTKLRPLRKQSNTKTSIWRAKMDIMALKTSHSYWALLGSSSGPAVFSPERVLLLYGMDNKGHCGP